MKNFLNLSQLNDIIIFQEERSDWNLTQAELGNEEYIYGHKPSISISADGMVETTSGSDSAHIGKSGYLRIKDMSTAKMMLLNNAKISVNFIDW